MGGLFFIQVPLPLYQGLFQVPWWWCDDEERRQELLNKTTSSCWLTDNTRKKAEAGSQVPAYACVETHCPTRDRVTKPLTAVHLDADIWRKFRRELHCKWTNLLQMAWLNPESVIIGHSHLVSWNFFSRRRLQVNPPVSFQPHGMFVQREKIDAEVEFCGKEKIHGDYISLSVPFHVYCCIDYRVNEVSLNMRSIIYLLLCWYVKIKPYHFCWWPHAILGVVLIVSVIDWQQPIIKTIL